MTESKTATVIFAWAGLIALWCCVFIFHRRFRGDDLRFHLQVLLDRTRDIGADGPAEQAIAKALQLADLWSGMLIMTVRPLEPPAPGRPCIVANETIRLVSDHIISGCPLLWPGFIWATLYRAVENRVRAICCGEYQW